MLEGVDLDQPATVLWWVDGDRPTKESDWANSTTRKFERLPEAINFVMALLTETAQANALVCFESPPFWLRFDVEDQVWRRVDQRRN